MLKPLRVVAAVIRHNDRILACRRMKDKVAGGKWEFPGGKVESGETDQEALARELAEELGIGRCSIGALVSRSTAGASAVKIDLACYWVDVAYPPGESTDHDVLRWCTVSELQKLDWAEADRDVVAQLRTLSDSKLSVNTTMEPQ